MKTTKKHYELFVTWVKYYLKKYAINDWSFYYLHSGEGPIASTNTQLIGRTATFYLRKEFNFKKEEFTDEFIRDTARHEVIHVLLAEIADLLGAFCSEDEAKTATEAVTCKLTNLMNDH